MVYLTTNQKQWILVHNTRRLISPREIRANSVTLKSSKRWGQVPPLSLSHLGTFGRVRLVRHRGTSQLYAMKILKKETIIKMKQVEHLCNEKKLLGMISSKFITKLYMTFQDEQKLYLILEYIPGGELFTHLRKAGKFPNDVAKFYCAELICAIEALHSHDIAYRDLKPENVLLDKGGHIVLADMGFAKQVFSKTFTMCGTPEYLAPETILGLGHDKRVDFWALGILLYEFLVGVPPFYHEDPYQVYDMIMTTKPRYPKYLHPYAIEFLKGLLKREPGKRLGCGLDGISEIKNHKWFYGVDWDMVQCKEIHTPIPIYLKRDDDTRHYERYPDSLDYTGGDLASDQQLMFRDF